MRIALWQGGSTAGDARAALAAAAGAAAGRGAGLLVLPEMFATGYAIGAEAASRLAEPREGPFARHAAEVARAQRIAIAYGYPERGADGAVYNAAQLVDASGVARLHCRKTHLFGDLDRAMFSPGTALAPLAECAGMRVGMLICYDVEFPEAVRALALAGADVVLVPTALMRPFECVARTLVPARAIESQVFVAYANRTGEEAGIGYCGLSCVVGPDGSELARAGADPALLVADLDADTLARSRRQMPYLADRRPALYAQAVSSPAARTPAASSATA